VVYKVDDSEKYCLAVCLISVDEYKALKSGCAFNFKYN
jgi:hypothetical protein